MADQMMTSSMTSHDPERSRPWLQYFKAHYFENGSR